MLSICVILITVFSYSTFYRFVVYNWWYFLDNYKVTRLNKYIEVLKVVILVKLLIVYNDNTYILY